MKTINFTIFLYCGIFLIPHLLQAQNCSPDSSKRYQQFDASAPNNFICQIIVERKKKRYNATASFVSANVLVGAGHSFRERSFSKIRSLIIYAGRHNENGINKWLFTKKYKRKELKTFIPKRFQKKSDPDYDYAYVALPENVTVDFFQLSQFEKLKDHTDSIFVSGYPGDKGNKELWKKGDTPQSIVNKDAVLLYSIYTYVADSGAPLWCRTENTYFIIGVHGTGHYHNESCNAAAKLTDKRILELRNFIDKNKK